MADWLVLSEYGTYVEAHAYQLHKAYEKSTPLSGWTCDTTNYCLNTSQVSVLS